MYRCNDCGLHFDEPEFIIAKEPHEYWGVPIDEAFTEYHCPYCGSADFESGSVCSVKVIARPVLGITPANFTVGKQDEVWANDGDDAVELVLDDIADSLEDCGMEFDDLCIEKSEVQKLL